MCATRFGPEPPATKPAPFFRDRLASPKKNRTTRVRSPIGPIIRMSGRSYLAVFINHILLALMSILTRLMIEADMTTPLHSVPKSAPNVVPCAAKPLSGISGLLMLLSLSACVPAIAVGGAVGVASLAHQDRPLGQGLDDSSATALIKTRLVAAPGYDLDRVDVKIRNNMVLLAGAVYGPDDRIEAERIAWSVKGVQEVANEIVVAKPRSIGRRIADQRISDSIKGRFIAAKSIKGINFNVEAFDGVVFLLGRARNQDELIAATDLASRVPGVTKVVSYIDVEPASPYSQLSQTASAQTSFDQTASLQTDFSQSVTSDQFQPRR